jgi:Uma2 family endonuclease
MSHTAETKGIRPTAILKRGKSARRYTLEEYLRREARAKEQHEFYNGIISKTPMATGSHNIVVANTSAALVTAFIAQDKPYLVFGSQQLVYLPALNFSLYPDILVVAEAPIYWDDNEILLINPLMVIEVLSKSTRAYDRGEKFSEYKTLESFQEYVLIDPNQCRMESRFREAPDLWRDSIVTDLEASIALKSVGCDLRLADVYRHISFK